MEIADEVVDAGDEIRIPEDIPPIHVGVLLLYGILLVLGVVWIALGNYPLLDGPVGEILGEVVVAALVGGAAVLMTNWLWRRTDWFRSIEREVAARFGNVSIGVVLQLAAASSIAEEMFFRGALQTWLGRWLEDPWAGWAVTSILFGVLHTGPKFRALLPWTVFAVAAGLLLGAAFLLTDNILVPIVIHFIINAVNLRRVVLRAERS